MSLQFFLKIGLYPLCKYCRYLFLYILDAVKWSKMYHIKKSKYLKESSTIIYLYPLSINDKFMYKECLLMH